MYVEEYNIQNCSGLPDTCSSAASYIGYVYFNAIICSIGVIFNMLNLAVLTRPGFPLYSSLKIFLQFLSFTDMCACLCALPIGLIRCIHALARSKYYMNLYAVYIYLPITNLFGTSSTLLTVAVATDRFFTVTCSKFNAVSLKYIYAKVIVFIIFIIAILLNLPFYFYKRVTMDGQEVTEFGNGAGMELFTWIRMVLTKVLPIISVSVLNILLLITVRLANIKAQQLQTLELQKKRLHSQSKMTGMLLSITFVFLACNIVEPFSHSTIYQTIFGECAILTEQYATYRMLTNLLEIVSYSSNFVSFCVFNEQFVNILKSMLPCCSTREEKQKLLLSMRQDSVTSEPKLFTIIYQSE